MTILQLIEQVGLVVVLIVLTSPLWAGYIFYLMFQRRSDRESLTATHEWCDAGEALTELYTKNPITQTVSREESLLIARREAAYQRFLVAHPHISSR